MTADDIARRYHDYATKDRAAAIAELTTIDCPVAFSVVHFGLLGYGIMRTDAAHFLGFSGDDIVATRQGNILEQSS